MEPLDINLSGLSRVLVPIDFSDAAFAAQTAALTWVGDPSHLHILHVLPPLSPGEPGITWQTVNTASRQQHVEQSFRDRFPSKPYEKVQFTVLVGTPSIEIIRYAKEQQISLIVIPSHGRTGMGRLMLGSVAERVVRRSPCPVLVLRR
ncbi:MAG: universal stress protein [Synechococcales cyanobacterium K44_A2020_017]|nr:universal stress protein [Synechococcales cyanobacterium K32_A2020_035]MBF2096500.1 universal stress protein [Synechococcales cyanobacterium K44_A2020_017]